jgi:formylglycine-generating enzyme required for sulfatase activity
LRVFVCYASEDKSRVRELCRRLRDDGFEPWLDDEQLLPGQDWELEISAAVRSSDAVMVCLSTASVGKVGYVQKELRLVLDAAEYQPEGRIFVVPVRLEPCPVPSRLSRLQFADLFVDDGYERLKAALTAGPERLNGASPLTLPPRAETHFAKPRQRHRLLIIVPGVLVMIAAGMALYMTTRPTRIGPRIGPQPATPPAAQSTKPTLEFAGMVIIPGGRFLMGRNDPSDPDSSPAHEVTLPAFHLDRTPVTSALFRNFSPSTAIALGGDEAPVTRVSWDEAAAYCLAQGKRLPSEEEWEFAARGSDGRLYPWGESFDAGAVNTLESGIGHPEPVGTRSHNVSPYGVTDMSGNVWQWCSDDYRPYPGGSVTAIPRGAKVIRGGSYQSDRRHVTSVTRNLELPSKRSPAIGFRCAK